MIGRLCLSVTLPLVFGAVQQENPPAGWSVFTSKEGRFAVALPGKPTESKQRVMTATGNLDVFLFVVEGKSDTAYVVSYSDLPADEVKPGTEAKRLDFARDGAVSNARGKLRTDTEKKVTIDDFPGREFTVEAEKGVVIKMRIYAVNQRLYQMMAMGAGGFAQSKEATIFLDSLRLSK